MPRAARRQNGDRRADVGADVEGPAGEGQRTQAGLVSDQRGLDEALVHRVLPVLEGCRSAPRGLQFGDHRLERTARRPSTSRQASPPAAPMAGPVASHSGDSEEPGVDYRPEGSDPDQNVPT
jgi:hypothetical protein